MEGDDVTADDEMVILSTGASHSQWIHLRPLHMLLRGASKVAMENKVGVVPEGELKVVADHLHASIGPALKDAPAPEGAVATVRLLDADAFMSVRRVLGISEASFYASLALQEGRSESNMRSIPVAHASGKSKSFFFLSPDQYYIFKSADAHDLRTLRRIVPAYLAHFEAHADSLLPRYVAVISLRVNGWLRPLDFIVMCNALGGMRPIQSRFDMKGSTYRRVASAKERGKSHPVFKDEDWLNEGRRLSFPMVPADAPSSRECFLQVRAKADCASP